MKRTRIVVALGVISFVILTFTAFPEPMTSAADRAPADRDVAAQAEPAAGTADVPAAKAGPPPAKPKAKTQAPASHVSPPQATKTKREATGRPSESPTRSPCPPLGSNPPDPEPHGRCPELLVISNGAPFDYIRRYNGLTGGIMGTFARDLDSAEGLAVGPDGNVYVSCAGSTNGVLVYSHHTGGLIDTFVSDVDSPTGLTFGPDDDLYVCSTGTDEILHYDGENGDFIDALISVVSPAGLAFGPDGNLYVSTDDVVKQCNPNTGDCVDFTQGDGLAGAGSLAFDRNGNLYVCSVNTGNILRYDEAGLPNPVDGQSGAIFILQGSGGLDGPGGLAFDRNGRLYVSSVNTDSILRYHQDGEPFPADGQTGATFVPQGSYGPTEPGDLVFIHELCAPCPDDQCPSCRQPRTNTVVSCYSRSEAEMSIAINPTNPNNLVIAAHSPGTNHPTLNTFYSTDGGEAWFSRPIGNVDDDFGLNRGDPMVAFDAYGNVYAGSLAGMGEASRRVVVARSVDVGQSYTRFAAVDGPKKELDKCLMSTDLSPDSPYQNNIYVAYTGPHLVNGDRVGDEIRVAVSSDGGSSFPTRTPINDDAQSNNADLACYATPAVDRDGRVYVVWVDYSHRVGQLDNLHPGSDDCDHAEQLSDDDKEGLWLRFNTEVSLTAELNPAECGGGIDTIFSDVWYKYHVPDSLDNEDVVISTFGTSFDTVLAVYDDASTVCPACPTSNGRSIVAHCNDDIITATNEITTLSQVTMTSPQANDCWLIRVGVKDGQEDTAGPGALKIEYLKSGWGACCLGADDERYCEHYAEEQDCNDDGGFFTAGEVCSSLTCPVQDVIKIDYCEDATQDPSTWHDDQQIATTGVYMYAVNGEPYLIPAITSRGIASCPSIDVDRSDGPYQGRVYVAYTVIPDRQNHPKDTDIAIRYSNDGGVTWLPQESPGYVRVNNDTTNTSQFHPWLDVDQETGQVCVVWYDARRDDGNLGNGNGYGNEHVEVYAAFSGDGGNTWQNVQVSDGQSDQSVHNSAPGAYLGHYYEYIGVAFDDSVAHVVWADNSCNDGNLDILTQRIRTWHVDAALTGGNPDGRTWGTAYDDLQDALNAIEQDRAGTIHLVYVAGGEYTPSMGTAQCPISGDDGDDRCATFQLHNNLKIAGGYRGNDGSDFDPYDRAVQSFPTILSGDIGNVGDKSDNSYHVVTGDGVNETAVLDGVTITAGYANNATFPHNSGAGMYNVDASPTINACTFYMNDADGNGGAIHNGTGTGNNGSSPILYNCLFRENHAQGKGGGMYNSSGSSVTVTNCTFSRNKSLDGTGGGIYNVDGDTAVTSCILWRNSGCGSAGTDQIDGANVTGNYTCIQGGWPVLRSTNIPDDPQFVHDPAEGNFNLNLRPYSPCINAGDPAFAPPPHRDLAGNPRICLGFVDMGAYEFTRADFNGDGEVNEADGQTLGPLLLGSDTDPDRLLVADMNADGMVNGADVQLFVDVAMAGRRPAPPRIKPVEVAVRVDCNGNGVPDAEDIAKGTSRDCNKNAIPDECDVDPTDPDGDGFVSLDADGNGVPDECLLLELLKLAAEVAPAAPPEPLLPEGISDCVGLAVGCYNDCNARRPRPPEALCRELALTAFEWCLAQQPAYAKPEAKPASKAAPKPELKPEQREQRQTKPPVRPCSPRGT